MPGSLYPIRPVTDPRSTVGAELLVIEEWQTNQYVKQAYRKLGRQGAISMTCEEQIHFSLQTERTNWFIENSCTGLYMRKTVIGSKILLAGYRGDRVYVSVESQLAVYLEPELLTYAKLRWFDTPVLTPDTKTGWKRGSVNVTMASRRSGKSQLMRRLLLDEKRHHRTCI